MVIIRMEEAFEVVKFNLLLLQVFVHTLTECPHHAGTGCKYTPPGSFLPSS